MASGVGAIPPASRLEPPGPSTHQSPNACRDAGILPAVGDVLGRAGTALAGGSGQVPRARSRPGADSPGYPSGDPSTQWCAGASRCWRHQGRRAVPRRPPAPCAPNPPILPDIAHPAMAFPAGLEPATAGPVRGQGRARVGHRPWWRSWPAGSGPRGRSGAGHGPPGCATDQRAHGARWRGNQD